MLYKLFGVTYGGGSYDSSVYSSSGTTSTGTGSGSSGSGSVLTNTGFDVLAAATLACTIIFVSLVVRFWRRKPAKELAE